MTPEQERDHYKAWNETLSTSLAAMRRERDEARQRGERAEAVCKRLTSRGIFEGWSAADWSSLISDATAALSPAPAAGGEPAPLTFGALRQANDERAKQWNASGANVPLIFALVEMAGEAGEACNVGKKLARTELGLAGGTTDMGPLEEEVADVVICADLVARKAGFDLGAAVARKFNATSRKRGFSIMLPEPAPSTDAGGAA